MTTRDKLAIAMALAPEYGPEHTLDALEAIVQEARDEAIEEAALLLEGTHRRDGKNCEGIRLNPRI